MNKKIYIVLSVLLLIQITGLGQELPPILNFTPETYGADNQNWMISQSENGYIFVANNKGLLEFNGANWTLYASPNESIIRCVKAIDDKIYTGCYRNFGFWNRNSTGDMEYTSLSDSLKIDLYEDEHFWNIVQQNKWLLFQSLDRILILDTENDEINTIEADNVITKLYKAKNEIYFQVKGEGLYTIDTGEKVLIDNSEIAKNSRIINLFIIENELTFITERNGFYKLINSKLKKWNSPIDELLTNLNIYSGIQNKDGNMVLGSISNGIFHITNEGNLLYHLNQSYGLANNTVLSLFEDSDANIWLGLDNGIDCINANTPLQSFDDRNGRIGTTYSSAIHKDHLYLGTNQGLFYKPVGKNAEFKFIEGTAGQVWNLRVINDQLFCGHNLGTFLINENSVDLISNVQGTWDIKELPKFPGMLLQGNYDGLYILTNSDGAWKIRSKLEGFNISSRHFELTPSNTILVNHEYKGVYELKVDSLLTRVIEFSKLESIEKGANSSLVKFNNDIFYASKNGIFKFDHNEHIFYREEKLSAIFDNGEYVSGKLVADNDQRLWAFTKSFIYRITREKLGSSLQLEKITIPQLLRNEMEGYENVSYYQDGRYIFGTSNGYFLLDPAEQATREYEITINRVISTSFSGNNTNLSLNDAGDFKADENNFVFQYSVPQYEKYQITEYQYRLDGVNTEWSPWANSPSVIIENLKYGTYQFQVRAKINNENTRNTATYDFVINRPLFLSDVAIVIYVMLAVLLFFTIHWFYKRYYRNQRTRILEKATNELKLKELASQKQIIQLQNDGLNQEIEARNRELAISTVSMINKNTMLNNIKDELKRFENAMEIKPVIKLIDNSINNQQDWKFLEEAFNHADKDFFKKVKKLHPELTPNDLRLCVYLRLNLSSKEIAQLLNISTRSVEIKRYRLRKKVNLERKVNLNDYFINL